jgi:hypothetical protein
MQFLLENAQIETLDGRTRLIFDVCFESITDARNWFDPIKNCKLVAEIRKWRQRRSKDANALFWEIVGLLAEHLRTDRDSVYLTLLSRYGVCIYVVVHKDHFKDLKEIYRLVEEVGTVKVNGQEGTQVRCFKSSSQYDSAEMSRLITGALTEINDLHIPFVPRSEIDRALREWGK